MRECYILTMKKLDYIIERLKKKVEEEGESPDEVRTNVVLEALPALIAVWKAVYEKKLRERQIFRAASGIHVIFREEGGVGIREFSEYLLKGELMPEGDFELSILDRRINRRDAVKALKELVKGSTGIPKAKVVIEGWREVLIGLRWRIKFELGKGSGELLVSDLSEEEILDWPPIGEEEAVEIAKKEVVKLAGKGRRRRTKARGVKVVRSWDSFFFEEREEIKARARILGEDDRKYLLLAWSHGKRFLMELSKLTGRVLGYVEVPTREEIEKFAEREGKALGIKVMLGEEEFSGGNLRIRASDEKGWYSLLFVLDSGRIKLSEISVTPSGVEDMLRLFSEDPRARVISHAYSKGLLKISGMGSGGRYSLLIDLSKPGEPKLIDLKVKRGLFDRLRSIFRER